jgi:antibiotic biosynthesis monooxygenase (ABM) superfamily enzyme
MKARLRFLALVWLAAFLILMSLFLAFGRQLNGLPLPLRVLIVSGVLVVSMTQVVIPRSNRYLRR